MEEKLYQCDTCKKRKSIHDKKIPDCCGKPMKQIPLKICTEPHDAEYSGPFEEDEPCDDGRAGDIK